MIFFNQKRKKIKWKPITETELNNEVITSYNRMSLEEKKIWEIIKVKPKK